jgi:hypothetical protein
VAGQSGIEEGGGQARSSARAFAPIQWVVTSAGLTGLLLGVGYVVRAAHGELLGIELEAAGVSDYLQTAGSFALGVALLYLRLAADVWSNVAGHPLGWLGSALAVGGAILLLRLRGRRLRRPGPPIPFALATTAALVVVGAYWDVPVLQVKGVLLAHVECNRTWNLPDGLEHRTSQLWRNMICSRIGGPRGQAGATSGVFASCTCAAAATHDAALRAYFLGGASWTIVLVLVAASAARSVERRTNGSLRRDATLGLLLVTCATSVTMLPYVYGKIVQSTTVPVGSVTLEGESDPTNGYIISGGATDLIVFVPADRSILRVPQSRVRETHLTDLADVMVERMKNTR